MAPSLETFRELVRASEPFFQRRPWEFLEETNLIGVELDEGERYYCSISGILGEVMGLHVYIGDAGFEFFRKAAAGALHTIGEFYGGQHSLYVHSASARELTKGDKEALSAAGFNHRQRGEYLLYRCTRPGYHPWFVNEGEAMILARCLRAVNFFIEHLLDSQPKIWGQESRFPVLRALPADSGSDYEMRVMERPRPPQRIPRLPVLDEQRLAAIRTMRFPARGMMELDHFYGGATIGGRYDRKACIRLGLAIDSETAHAYPPEIAMPDVATGEILARVVQRAIEASGIRPVEIHVREQEFKTLLQPLGKALGFVVKLKSELPALDYAKSSLLAAMGDPGEILG